MERFLREWREDAQSRNQFETAIFIGDKVLALTNSDADAIRLAQLHFSIGNYSRAQSLLSRGDLISRDPQCQHLAAHCQIKQGRLDEALVILGERTPPRLLASIGHKRKLARLDVSAKNGAGKHNKSGTRAEGTTLPDSKSVAELAEIRFQAGMCYLRGICYAKQNAFDRAKECYIDAVKIDVQCFEAFDQLMKNALMTPDEEWMLLDELDFDSISVGDNISASQQAAELTKMLYTSRLSKYKKPAQFMAAIETLSTHYKLSANPDLLLSKAELFFKQCRFKEALALTTTILENDRYNFGILPVHLSCLLELNEKNALFMLSHELADKYPEEPATWFAVGVYYLCIGKIAESRRFFSKSSTMDPHFGPAWIGFAHTFAAEGEHDQAISAYSTAARLFQGTHLPQLFLGMQNVQLQNMPLAHEYLKAAYQLCETDPLVLSELGVVYYHDGLISESIKAFNAALEAAQEIDADPRTIVTTRANLGHAYRRDGQWDRALEEFEEVLRQGGRDAAIFCAKAMILLDKEQAWEATVAVHEALAINPQDPIANELLSKALSETAAMGPLYPLGDELDVEFFLDRKKDAVRNSRRTRQAKPPEVLDDDEMDVSRS